MTRIIRSREYFNDLIRIDDFIAVELDNPKTALRDIEEIENAVNKLEAFPEMGKVFSFANVIKTGYRYIIHGEYIIFYKIKDEDVYIYRVFSTRTDYMKIVIGNLV